MPNLRIHRRASLRAVEFPPKGRKCSARTSRCSKRPGQRIGRPAAASCTLLKDPRIADGAAGNTEAVNAGVPEHAETLFGGKRSPLPSTVRPPACRLICASTSQLLGPT